MTIQPIILAPALSLPVSYSKVGPGDGANKTTAP